MYKELKVLIEKIKRPGNMAHTAPTQQTMERLKELEGRKRNIL